jgi:hypothetical protein
MKGPMRVRLVYVDMEPATLFPPTLKTGPIHPLGVILGMGHRRNNCSVRLQVEG